MKRLEDMTLEELWRLFPIELVKHDPDWEEWAREEIELLSELLGDNILTITHIGSTAIPAIMAKPIIDLLVEIPADADRKIIKERMLSRGYILMSESRERMSFNKGYTPSGYAEKVFHIHFHPSGDNDEVLFRDYLRSHPRAAREYEELKLSLLPAYRNNRDGYTEAKTDFIGKIISLARIEMSGRFIDCNRM